jgi:hypothetical protein
LILKRVAQVETSVQVQNLSGSPAELVMTYYDRDGQTRPDWVQRAGVAANRSATFYTPGADNPLPPGFAGSAVLQASQPVGAIVNQQAQPDAPPYWVGSFVAPQTPGTAVYLPYAMKTSTRTSTLTVQNASATATTVTATFFGTAGPIANVQVFLPPLASRQLVLAERAELPANMEASVVLQASQPIVAVGDVVDIPTGIHALYTGSPAGAPAQFAPLVFNDRPSPTGSWDSEVRVQNVSGAQASVRVRIQPTGGGTEISPPAVTVAPNAAHTFRMREVAGLGSNFVGSAQIEANVNVMAVVFEYNTIARNGMTYNAFSPAAGTTHISVPLIFKDYNNFNSGIQVQNLDDSDARVCATYQVDTRGTPSQALECKVVHANTSETFYQGDPDNQIPPDSTGSAVLENIGGAQRLVAIVNLVNYARGGDASATNEGLNY